MLKYLLAESGKRLFRGRWLVVAAWLVLLAAASFGAARAPGQLLGGSGAIAGSASQAVDARLRREFENPYAKALVVTLRDPVLTLDDPAYATLLREAAGRLGATPGVTRVLGYLDTKDARMRTPDGHGTFLTVGLDAETVEAEEALVPRVRAALTPVRQANPGTEVHVTGRAALTTDVNVFAAADSARAESRALPLALVVLVLAFGSLVAAGVPLAMGVVTTTLAMGALFLVAQSTGLSNLAQNIITMLGLGLGIDYSLILVSRYREALAAGAGREEAVAETMGTAGAAVLYSGATVLIGLAGLFLSPLLETRSVGIGGVLVVLASIAAALTLVPALLGILGPRLEWPRALSRTLTGPSGRRAWARWAEGVMARPGRALAAAIALLLLAAWPATWLAAGIPDQKWLPEQMEAKKGLDALAEMKLGWSVFPVYVIATGTREGPVTAQHLGGLLKVSRTLRADPRVKEVFSPVDLQAGLSPVAYALLYADTAEALARHPQIGELFLSRDRRSALFQVVLEDDVTIPESKAFVEAIARDAASEGLTLAVGGQPVFYNDYDAAMATSAPRVVGFVVASTLLVLFLAYRSWLLPLKAIAMNLLAVAAGYGLLVLVFCSAWGHRLVGLTEPLDVIPQAIPLIIFCVVFGLSMDYEVFLLSRIKEEYDAHGDNRRATADGLASTAGLITSAAAVMALVFGAFTLADIVLVKLIGVGLAATILVDATVVRCLAVPAAMRLLGRWNWVPGSRAQKRLRTPMA